MSKVPFHYQVAELVMELMQQGTHRATVQDKLEAGSIVQIETEVRSFQLPGEIFIASADIYTDLSPAAIKLVIQIQQELKMNNPLWECDKTKRETRSALAQLKRKEILYSIDHTNMFIVNPAKIRKGRPLAIYGAMYDYAKKMYSQNPRWYPTTEDIKRLMSPRVLDVSTC